MARARWSLLIFPGIMSPIATIAALCTHSVSISSATPGRLAGSRINAICGGTGLGPGHRPQPHRG